MTLHEKRLVALTVFFGSLLGLVAGVSLFDVWLYHHWGVEATISRAMRDVHPLVIMALGLNIGAVVGGLSCHFWWPQPPRALDPDLPPAYRRR
jgi:hypothetical protein